MDADCDTHNTPQMKQQACERRYKCDLADTSVNFSEHVTVCSSVSEAGRQTECMVCTGQVCAPRCNCECTNKRVCVTGVQLEWC